MNKQPYAVPPRWWGPKLRPTVVRATRGYRRWQLHHKQKVRGIQVHGAEHLSQALDADYGVVIAPNHATHYDSNSLYLAADRLGTPLYYMTAWQVFEMSTPWQRRLMQWMGCFSIDRESADRQAFKQAVKILREERAPLVIFPEGDIYHVSDRIMPFRQGAAAVALAAARRSPRPVVVVPCAIKFRYLENPLPQLHRVMTELEQRLLLSPEPTLPLPDRIYRFGEALIGVKEMEFLGVVQSGPLAERKQRLAESILDRMEQRHQLAHESIDIPTRVKRLRQQLISQLLQAAPNARTASGSLRRDMDALFFVTQLYSYPSDYLRANPTTERLAETLDKLEEDVLERNLPTVKGRRQVNIAFGAPLLVSEGEGRRDAVERLTADMQNAVQGLMDELRQRLAQNQSGVKAAATPIPLRD